VPGCRQFSSHHHPPPSATLCLCANGICIIAFLSISLLTTDHTTPRTTRASTCYRLPVAHFISHFTPPLPAWTGQAEKAHTLPALTYLPGPAALLGIQTLWYLGHGYVPACYLPPTCGMVTGAYALPAPRRFRVYHYAHHIRSRACILLRASAPSCLYPRLPLHLPCHCLLAYPTFLAFSATAAGPLRLRQVRNIACAACCSACQQCFPPPPPGKLSWDGAPLALTPLSQLGEGPLGQAGLPFLRC